MNFFSFLNKSAIYRLYFKIQVLADTYFQQEPTMTPLNELPCPTEKTLNTTTTSEFANWDWSSKEF